MTPHGFNASNWVERLAQSLESLSKVEENYCSELSATSSRNANLDKQMASGFDSPSNRRSFLYYRARQRESSYYRTHYGALFSTLAAVKAVLRKHPVLNRALGYSVDNEEFFMAIPNVGSGEADLDRMVVGLMSCTKENGFRETASRLEKFLAPEEECQFTGYQMSVFRGLQLDEEFEVANGISITPFDSIKDYLDPSRLENFVPGLSQINRRGPMGVVRKPFQWKPVILSSGSNSGETYAWDKEFPDDSDLVVNLLAITHETPVLNMMRLMAFVNHEVWELVGLPGHSGSVGWSGGLPVNDHLGNTALCLEKFSKAKDMFVSLKCSGDEQAMYKLIISRISRSLLRRGELALEDKLLDVAIAMEMMYELERQELSYKLRMRASCFLERSSEKRVETFERMKKFYNARSSVVHNDKKMQKKKQEKPKEYHQDVSEQFNEGFDLARRTLFKLLLEGRPSDWDELVLSVGSQ